MMRPKIEPCWMYSATPYPAVSTKGATGHTLGAAGIMEAVISALCLRHGLVPGGGATDIDPQLKVNFVQRPHSKSVQRAISNSFGFGAQSIAVFFFRGRTRDGNIC